MGSDEMGGGRGLWIKLSVDFLDDPKIIQAGIEGEALFIRCLAWAKKQREPIIPEVMLPRIGFSIGDPLAVADRLVDIGLWFRTGDGFGITAWQDWQTDTSAVRSVAGSRGNHARWHKGKKVDGCDLCADQIVEKPVSDDARRLCDLLAELMVGNGCKPPTITATWLKDMDAIMRLDKRAAADVERVIRWCQQDSFWRSNIMSPSKLRRQFDALVLRMGLTVPAEVKPIVPAWVADDDCPHCHGEGLVEVDDNTFGPCPCRRSG